MVAFQSAGTGMQSQERLTPCPKCGHDAKLERIQVTYRPGSKQSIPISNDAESVYRYRCANAGCGYQFERLGLSEGLHSDFSEP